MSDWQCPDPGGEFTEQGAWHCKRRPCECHVALIHELMERGEKDKR